MLTKEYINGVKSQGNGVLAKAISEIKDSGQIIFFLENLGYLPKDFDGNLLLPFLKNDSHQVRLWAVKNIGKLEDIRYLEHLLPIAKNDGNSMVRREAISSIGRMRHPKIINIMIDFLYDPDPKIVLQAIRALIIFKRIFIANNQIKSLSDKALGSFYTFICSH